VIRAVVFDLWGTLVDWPADESAALQERLAELMGVEVERFRELWRDPARESGPLAPFFRSIGAEDSAVDELVAMRHELTRRVLVPRDGVVETLRELRRREYRLGLITVCTEDVAVLWPETPFAGLFGATVFSATCGLLKPDSRIYRLACDELGVEPAECLYVGDGANDELAGAERVGMRAVLLDGPRPPAWNGERIASIPDVLALC